MKVYEVLNPQVLQIIERDPNDLELLDELLVGHYMALDIQEYALLRISQTLSLIEKSVYRMEDNIG